MKIVLPIFLVAVVGSAQKPHADFSRDRRHYENLLGFPGISQYRTQNSAIYNGGVRQFGAALPNQDQQTGLNSDTRSGLNRADQIALNYNLNLPFEQYFGRNHPNNQERPGFMSVQNFNTQDNSFNDPGRQTFNNLGSKNLNQPMRSHIQNSNNFNFQRPQLEHHRNAQNAVFPNNEKIHDVRFSNRQNFLGFQVAGFPNIPPIPQNAQRLGNIGYNTLGGQARRPTTQVQPNIQVTTASPNNQQTLNQMTAQNSQGKNASISESLEAITMILDNPLFGNLFDSFGFSNHKNSSFSRIIDNIKNTVEKIQEQERKANRTKGNSASGENSQTITKLTTTNKPIQLTTPPHKNANSDLRRGDLSIQRLLDEVMAELLKTENTQQLRQVTPQTTTSTTTTSSPKVLTSQNRPSNQTLIQADGLKMLLEEVFRMLHPRVLHVASASSTPTVEELHHSSMDATGDTQVATPLHPLNGTVSFKRKANNTAQLYAVVFLFLNANSTVNDEGNINVKP